MALGQSLGLVLAAFVAILVAVIVMAFRERRQGRAIVAGDAAAEAASDARVMFTIFAAIPGGMVLTVIVAWLVFL
jgi:cbb3-type cytochrome oxidase subunit 3